MNKIIDISGLPEEYNELVKEFVELLRKKAEKRKMNQSDCESHSISKEIAMDGLSEIEVDFITSLVDVIRLRVNQEPKHIRTYPLGEIDNISRKDSYEEYLAYKFPFLYDDEE